MGFECLGLSFFDITIHFPWVISGSDGIPYHRLQAIRIGVMLAFSYYGLLHLIGKSQAFYPLHFLTTLPLLHALISGDYLYRRDATFTTMGRNTFFWICLIFCYLAARPEASKYLKYKSTN